MVAACMARAATSSASSSMQAAVLVFERGAPISCRAKTSQPHTSPCQPQQSAVQVSWTLGKACVVW